MYCDVISRRSITMKIGYGHVMLTLAFALGLATLSTAIDLTDFDEGELDAPVVPAIPPVTGSQCFCGINLAIMLNVRKGLRTEHGNGAYLYGMIQEFLGYLAWQLDIGKDFSQHLVGVVTYDKFARKQFGLEEYTDKYSLLMEGIEMINYSNEPRSYPFQAMNYIYSNDSFFKNSDRHAPRLHNRNAVIVIDDGLLVKSTKRRREKLEKASEKLKGIATVFVIGLRNKTLDFDAYDDKSMNDEDMNRIGNWTTMATPTSEEFNNGRGNIITTSFFEEYKGLLIDQAAASNFVDKVMTRINQISTCEYLTGEVPDVCLPVKV